MILIQFLQLIMMTINLPATIKFPQDRLANKIFKFRTIYQVSKA